MSDSQSAGLMIETTPEGSKDQTLIHKWTVAVLAGLGVILVLIISATVAVAGMQNRAPRAAAEVVHVSGATFASTNYGSPDVSVGQLTAPATVGKGLTA